MSTRPCKCRPHPPSLLFPHPQAGGGGGLSLPPKSKGNTRKKIPLQVILELLQFQCYHCVVQLPCPPLGEVTPPPIGGNCHDIRGRSRGGRGRGNSDALPPDHVFLDPTVTVFH